MIKDVAGHLLNSKSVAIFVHINPDWDCIGSAFALRNILRSKNIKSDIFTQEKLSDYHGFMENDVICFSENAAKPDYECYCCVDVSGPDRTGDWEQFFSDTENTVCIDHHRSEKEFGAYRFVDSKRSSTGELIYEIAEEMGFSLTKEIASYLYCAISADTGSFQYASVNVRTFEILIKLFEAGVDGTYLSSMLYERNSLTQLKLKAAAIDSIKLCADGKIATASISYEIQQKYNASKPDTEGLASIPRSIDGVMISAFFKEEKDFVRVSLRASGDYDVECVARIFGGGGHKKAAGCTIEGKSLAQAEKAVTDELKKLISLN